MTEKQCTKCLTTKPVDQFYTRQNTTDGPRYPTTKCKTCDKKRIHAHVKVLRNKMVAYAGGKCKSCGYNRCIGALQFHHLDPSKKELEFSKVRNFNSTTKLEIDKCDLLCANCHAEAHHILNGGTIHH